MNATTHEAPAPITHWSGNFDKTQAHRPGGLLMAALVQCASERGQSMHEMAEAIGYSYPYLNLLIAGTRRVDQISDDFAQACALYLRVPRMTVLQLAGRIRPQDLFEPDLFHARALEPAMRFVAEDIMWGHLLTAELRASKAETQYCIVKLYEAATGKTLLPMELQARTLAREVHAMKRQLVKRRAALKRTQDSTAN
ncbi:helix-turn-helix domain-containing protein [Thiomonas delicata]|nr:helix-turn-helix transcriptional regulator [Thiomonas delicata]